MLRINGFGHGQGSSVPAETSVPIAVSAPTPSKTYEIASMARIAVEDLVAAVVRMGASDLHIKPDSPPILRVHGELNRLEGYEALTGEDVLGLLYQMLQDPVRL